MHTDIRTYLLAQPAIAGEIGTRLYPVKLPQAVTYPALSYQQIGGTTERHLQGRSTLKWARLQVDAWAPTIAAAQTIADAVADALDGYRGQAGNILITDSWQDSRSDGYEDDAEIHRTTLDFQIYYRETS